MPIRVCTGFGHGAAMLGEYLHSGTDLIREGSPICSSVTRCVAYMMRDSNDGQWSQLCNKFGWRCCMN
ncbi:hypothetical protein Elgi_17380 [Paenibacillus elgii]|nr:hypothetical protein Elgi_17380 [Paenibacillus elgii]